MSGYVRKIGRCVSLRGVREDEGASHINALTGLMVVMVVALISPCYDVYQVKS